MLSLLLALVMLAGMSSLAFAADEQSSLIAVSAVSITGPEEYIAGKVPDASAYSVPEDADYFIRNVIYYTGDEPAEHIISTKSGKQYGAVVIIGADSGYFFDYENDGPYYYTGTVSVNGDQITEDPLPTVAPLGFGYSTLYGINIEDDDLIVIIPFIPEANTENPEEDKEEFEPEKELTLAIITPTTVNVILENERVYANELTEIAKKANIQVKEGSDCATIICGVTEVNGCEMYYGYTFSTDENGNIKWDSPEVKFYPSYYDLTHYNPNENIYVLGTVVETDGEGYDVSKLPEWKVTDSSTYKFKSYVEARAVCNAKLGGMADEKYASYALAPTQTDGSYYFFRNYDGYWAYEGTEEFELSNGLVTDDEYYKYYTFYLLGKYTEHEHSYNIEEADSKYLVAEANCVHAKQYYKHCECGKIGEEIFETGYISYYAHVDSNNDGVCEVCNKVIETDDDNDNVEESFIDKILAFFQKILNWFKSIFQ